MSTVHELQQAGDVLQEPLYPRFGLHMRGVRDVPKRDLHGGAMHLDIAGGVRGVQHQLPRGDLLGVGVHCDERPGVSPMHDDQDRLLHDTGVPGEV